MSTPEFLKEFRLKYGIALLMIVLELLVAQAIIQQSLFQERAFRTQERVYRAESNDLDVQRTRELFYADTIQHIAVDPAHRTIYITQMTQNNSFTKWQSAENALYEGNPGFGDAHIQTDFQAMKPHYELLKWAYLSVVQSDNGPKSVDIRKQLTTMLQHDDAYVFAIYDAYKRLDADADTLDSNADNQVIRVQWYEIGLFFLALLTLVYESVFAIKPALKQLNADLNAEQFKSKRPTVPLPTLATEDTHAPV